MLWSTMKKFSVLILLLVFGIQYALAREYTQEELMAKRQKFKNMKVTGFTMAAIGSAMTLGGIVLAANGEWETTETPTGSQANAKDGAAVGGILMLIPGIPLTITGFILGGIGSKKVREYQVRLNSLSLGIEYKNDRKGLRLAYTF